MQPFEKKRFLEDGKNLQNDVYYGGDIFESLH